MIGQSEFKSRAALCRKLARREPANQTYWMAEAENWARLSNQILHDEDSTKAAPGILACLREKSGRVLFILA